MPSRVAPLRCARNSGSARAVARRDHHPLDLVSRGVDRAPAAAATAAPAGAVAADVDAEHLRRHEERREAVADLGDVARAGQRR